MAALFFVRTDEAALQRKKIKVLILFFIRVKNYFLTSCFALCF